MTIKFVRLLIIFLRLVMAKSKDVDKLIKIKRKEGWVIERTKNSHWKWVAPNGNFFYTSSTPSCPKAFKNIKEQVRKAEANHYGKKHGEEVGKDLGG